MLTQKRDTSRKLSWLLVCLLEQREERVCSQPNLSDIEHTMEIENDMGETTRESQDNNEED